MIRDILKQLTPYEKLMVARLVIRENQEELENKLDEDTMHGVHSEHLIEADDFLLCKQDEVKKADEEIIYLGDFYE